MVDESKYDAIVGAIYDAALEPLRLTTAVALIVEAINATGAHLVGVKKGTGEVVLSAITGFSPLGEVDYIERYARLDPRAPLSLAAPEGSWISCHHHLTQQFVDHSEFYQDFLIPCGSRFASIGKVSDTPEYAALFGVHMGPDRQPLDEEQLGFLHRLTPHFQRSMRLLNEASRLSNQWAVVKATLDSLGYAAMVCAADGELLVSNEAAAAVLEEKDGLVLLTSGRLHVQDASARKLLYQCLFSSDEDAVELRSNEISGAFLAPRPSGLPSYQVIVRRLQPERSAFTLQERLLFSITVSDPVRASVPTLRAVALLYGLTPAEARIAGLLLQGATPVEMAEQTFLKISTIRSQLRSLFAKTGTTRQAELMRLLRSIPSLR